MYVLGGYLFLLCIFLSRMIDILSFLYLNRGKISQILSKMYLMYKQPPYVKGEYSLVIKFNNITILIFWVFVSGL